MRSARPPPAPQARPRARFIRVARPAIAAAYLIAALAAPALAAFVPLLAYAAVAQNLGPLRLWPAALLGAAVSGSGALAAAALLLGALACLAARRTTKVQTERASLRQWRDAVQEDRLALAERTRDLAERQDLEVSCAVLAERARIAREIHDNVGHLLTRSVLQMEALAVTHEDDPALAKELAAVGATLHKALGTVRASVHDLHDEAFDPQTTLADLIGEFPELPARSPSRPKAFRALSPLPSWLSCARRSRTPARTGAPRASPSPSSVPRLLSARHRGQRTRGEPGR
ncbi:MAG: sensor histidine kinase [Adlercreutzia equolifaciens]